MVMVTELEFKPQVPQAGESSAETWHCVTAGGRRDCMNWKPSVRELPLRYDGVRI